MKTKKEEKKPTKADEKRILKAVKEKPWGQEMEEGLPVMEDMTKKFSEPISALYEADLEGITPIIGGNPYGDIVDAWMKGQAPGEAPTGLTEEQLKEAGISLTPGEVKPMDMEKLVELRKLYKPPAEWDTSSKEGKKLMDISTGFAYDDEIKSYFILGYHIKSNMKECFSLMNVSTWLFKQSIQHGVHVKPFKLFLNRKRGELDGTITNIINRPQGPAIRVSDKIDKWALTFQIEVFTPMITAELIINALKMGEKDGLGANRPMGYGQYKVTRFVILRKGLAYSKIAPGMAKGRYVVQE